MHSKKSLNMLNRRIVIMGALVIVLFLTISLGIRTNDFNKVTGAGNVESTYHTLLIVKSLQNSKIENHWFLPTITLGQARDKYISWGATVPTKTGDYIYTSFPSLGFLAPYVAFSIFNIDVNEENMAYFNFSIGALVSIILYLLLFNVLKICGYSSKVAMAGAVAGTIISIFSREVLQSHGVVYWVHGFYQLILVSTLYVLFNYLNSEEKKDYKKNSQSTFLIFLFFLGAMTEWTGYVFGVGVAILFWFGFFRQRPEKKLSLKIILSIALAGILTLLHAGFALGFESAINSFIGRFLARNTSSGNLNSLIGGYGLSYGLFVIIVISVVAFSFFIRQQKKESSELKINVIAFLFVAATIPLIENMIMLQHANVFSFDRLKFIFPASIIIAASFSRLSKKGRVFLYFTLIIASIQGYTSYKTDLGNYKQWGGIDAKNKFLASLISASTDVNCSVLLSNINVRGYANLLMNRSIYEFTPKEKSLELLEKNKSCSAVYIEGIPKFPDLPYYSSSLITKPDGKEILIAHLDSGSISSEFFITDQNWQNGIAKHWTGFLLPNTDNIKSQLVKGADIIFTNGEIRKIISINANGIYLNVNVDGAVLDVKETGLPSSFIVRRTLN